MSSVFKHFLVPEAVIVSEEELNELLKRHRIERENLPFIKSSDPAAISLNAGPGTVIKFVGRNPASGASEPYYRLVVD